MLDTLLPSLSQIRLLTQAAHRYHEALDETTLSYLAERGIDLDAVTGHRLGKVSEPATGHERFEGMLSIPYVSGTGDVIAFKFRRMDDQLPKYDSPSGQKAHLFNARCLISGGDTALVCEGELDTIVASSWFEVPAVGTPGTTWLDHWSRCLSDFDRVLIVRDHDVKEDGSDPGKKHAEKVQKQIEGAEIVTPPPGHDLTSWVLAEGGEAVAERLGL